MQIVTPSQLTKLLLNVSPHRTVFVWGPPGIGKSAIVEQFADDIGFDCVSLLGSQLAPEDLIGVPKIIDDKSVFCPPRNIARLDPYVLFIDELNACSFDVQKAFYSLINDRKLGEYNLPKGSVVLGAGNRAQDQAIVKPMSSALMNRMLHVELKPTVRDWLDWAGAHGIYHDIISYIETRPDHLVVAPPKTEETFTTPRSWHILSDAIKSYEGKVSLEEIDMLASGCLSNHHAKSFIAFLKQIQGRMQIEKILDGSQPLPRAPEDRDVLYFIVQSMRSQLVKNLPQEKDSVKSAHKLMASQAKRVITELCEINAEMASIIVADDDKDKSLPPWFIIEIMRDIPNIASRMTNKSNGKEK